MSNQEPLTNEQKVAQVKGILMQNLNQFYGQLVNFVRQTPIDEQLKQNAIFNLDQGVMWFEQGLKRLQFQVEAPADTTPDAPPPPADNDCCVEDKTEETNPTEGTVE